MYPSRSAAGLRFPALSNSKCSFGSDIFNPGLASDIRLANSESVALEFADCDSETREGKLMPSSLHFPSPTSWLPCPTPTQA